MAMIGFGKFKSDGVDAPKHIVAIIDRPSATFQTEVIIYKNSITFTDVDIHQYCDEIHSSGVCKYSDTGYCFIRTRARHWTIENTGISDWIIAEILIERIGKALRDYGTVFDGEDWAIRNSLNNLELWNENEFE